MVSSPRFLTSNILIMGKTANIDYLCAIRKIGNRTSFETIDIPASTELVSTLEGMVENSSASVLDMQSHMNYAFPEDQRGYMNYVSPYPYASSYINGTSYPESLSFQEYKDALSLKAENLTEEFEKGNKQLLKDAPAEYGKELTEFVERRLAEYKKSLKSTYLRQAKRFIQAKNYTRTLSEVKSQPGIRMYSTDTLGWSDFVYKVTDDITITLGTNFGYGSSSYFRLCLRYKGIDILPYSFVVKYYYANRRDILRYTRLYDVAHDSWNIAFDFVEKAANIAADDAHRFITEYVMEEIQQMMHGLESILKDPAAYAQGLADMAGKRTDCHFLTVCNMDQYDKQRYAAYPEEMAMVIKAEKITGSLDFLDNLTKLSESLPEISTYIDEIKEMSQAILPEIVRKVLTLGDEIADLQEKKASAQIVLDGLNEKAKPHMLAIDALHEEGKKKNAWLFWKDVEEGYAKNHKDYAELRALIENAKEDLSRISTELHMREEFREKLCDCIKRVENAGLGAEEKVVA